jgi:hypothetical protein
VLEPPHEATRSSAGWWASQELLEMIALKELKACRHGLHQNVEALRGRTVKLYQDNQAGRLRSAAQNVIQMPSSHDRDQGPRTLAPRKQDSTRRGLHSERSKPGRCTIAPTGPRYVVLAAAYAARAPALGRVDIGLTSLHRSLRLQAECSGSKIRHSASLSSQLSLQRLAPRLVTTTRYTVGKSAMASTAPSSGKTSSVKGKRYSHLPVLAASVMVSRSAAAFNLPLPPAASAPWRQTAPSRCRRTFRQSTGATACSGLRLCVKDGLLQACVLLATQGDNSRIRWSASQE